MGAPNANDMTTDKRTVSRYIPIFIVVAFLLKRAGQPYKSFETRSHSINREGGRLPPKKQRVAYAQQQAGRNTKTCKYLTARFAARVQAPRRLVLHVTVFFFHLQANFAAMD
jgi:CO/xanthine dehydrogenase Mo-binding subunit